MASPYDALLDAQPTQQRSEYDALLEQPKSGVGQALENAGAAALNVAKGFVKGFLPKFDTKSLVEIAFAPAAVASQTMQAAEGAIDAVKQVGEAEKTPAWSRERFEAGFNVAGQLAMIAGIKGGVEAAYRAPVTDVASVVNKEVISNAVKERNIQESVQPKRAGDGEGGTPSQTSGGSSVQPETQVPAQTPQVGDLWYQGVSKEGATQWVTHDINIARSYAARRGEGARINVYTPEQVGETAFADPEGNLISPQEYAKHNWSTTIQTGGKPLPNPIQTLPVSEGGVGLSDVGKPKETAPVPQPEQPRIVSTAVQTPEGIKTGTSFNQSHDEIVKGTPEGTKGFLVRENGQERFVGREEAANVAKASGQVKPENAGTTELHSQQLQESSPVPEANVSDVAQPLPQKGEGGGGVQPPAATPVATSSTEPTVSAIANRFVAERAAKGEVAPISPGQGYSAQEMVQQGLKMGPEEINQHVSDLMQGKGDPVKQAQAVRANESRLSQVSNQLSREYELDPTNMEKKLAADNAFKDLTDWHTGPVAKIKTIFHATGEGLQSEIPVDLSTFNGVREAWLKDTGKPPPPEVEPTLRKAADRVAKSNGEADASVAKVGAEVQKATSNRKLPTYEQVRNNILERLKAKTPCN